MSNDKDNGVNSLADETFFDDINDEDILYQTDKDKELEAEKQDDSIEAEKMKEKTQESIKLPDKPVKNAVKENKAASKNDDKSISPWLKRGLITVAVLSGLYGLGMVASPPEKVILKPTSLNVNQQPLKSQSSTVSEDALADFNNIKNQRTISQALRSGGVESLATQVINDVSPEIPDISESASIVNQELLSRVDTIDIALKGVVDAIKADTNSSDLVAVVAKQDELESKIKSLQDQLAEFIEIERKTENKAKSDVPETKPPILTAIMRVEGRGVFVTETGKEISLYKGERLIGFGTVKHVDINGCIYGYYGKKYEPKEASCK
jgi:hypothetical protein